MAVHRKVYDLSVGGAARSRMDARLNLTRTGALDSCFVDGCVSHPKGLTAAKQARLAAAKASMIAALQEETPGPLVCGSAGLGTYGARAIQVQRQPLLSHPPLYFAWPMRIPRPVLRVAWEC